ncbi:hypothetical protein LCGC14_2287250 [marine sediment metagenome]|uniref:Uncharacterized protein n=1 Tax=marine sediment metagenome TaxID=412755 RepID=A0A0F9F4Y0_9ZZZZ
MTKRGGRGGDLCMCRVGDDGPYTLGNIYKATHSQNMADHHIFSQQEN